MSFNVYSGNPTDRVVTIQRDGKEEEVLSHETAHSAGFKIAKVYAWGYGGSGSHQLAAAILLEELQSPLRVMEWISLFVREIISALDRDRPFCLTSAQIQEWHGTQDSKQAAS